MPSSSRSSSGSEHRAGAGAGDTGRGRVRGQATVELALCLPFVLVALLLVVQVLVVAHGQLVADQAARAGGRAAAVAPTLEVATRAAHAAVGPGDRVTVALRVAGDLVVVEVTLEVRTDVPLVGPLLPDLHLGSSSAFRIERGSEGG